MKAVVMAGGAGTRLRPLTCSLPKPMVPVGNRPIVEHVLRLLAGHGVEEALLTLHHFPQTIRDHVGDGSAFGLRTRFYVEDVPLGTAGSVGSVAAELDQTFVVISGDILTDFDLSGLVDFHRRQGAVLTVGLTTVDAPLEYGMVVCGKDGRVSRFVEKPSWGEVVSNQVNAGIYVVEPEILKLIDPGKSTDFGRDILPALVGAGRQVFGYRSPGYWCDVGSLDRYLRVHLDILEGRAKLDLGGGDSRFGDRVWTGPGVEVAPGVELTGPILIGAGCYLGAGSRIEGPAVLGRNVVVGGQASVKRSVVGDNSFIGRLAEVRGAVLGRGVRLGNRAAVYDGAVLADEVKVGEEAVVKPGVKVWPGRDIAPETVLGDSLVWGQTWGYGVFGASGVSGTVNVDLRPELVARLGAVFGASLEMGTKVIVGADAGPAGRLLEEALISGLGLSGCEVWRAGELPAVAVRYGIEGLGAAAGAHVGFADDGGPPGASGVAPGASGLCTIRFFDSTGLDLTRAETRRLERALGGEDFRRAAPDGVKEVRVLPGLAEAYLAGLEDRGRNLVRKGLSVAGQYANPWLETQARELWRRLDVGHTELEDGSAAFSFRLGRSGETVDLIDNLGRPLTPAQAWLVLSSVAIIRDDTPLAIPSDLPRAVAERLTALGARPVPCGAARIELLVRLRQLEKDAGPSLFRQSEMVSGGLLGVIGLLDYLADTGETLAEMVDESPIGEWVHLRVGCPWEVKGRVLQLLLEKEGDQPAGAEGLEVDAGQGQGRVLVLPDADRPAFHVYSEAASLAGAEELATLFARRVRELAGQEPDTGISPPAGQS